MSLTAFLTNPSVAAFIGAFSAFLLVVLTDWRRRRRKGQLLVYLVDDNRTIAKRKLENVEMLMELLNENKTIDAPIMPFQSVALSNTHQDVMDMLDANQNQAIAALVYWMSAIDGLLDDALRSAITLREYSEEGASNDAKRIVVGRLASQYRDAKRNLRILIEMCGYYVDGKPHKILEHRKPIGEASTDDR